MFVKSVNENCCRFVLGLSRRRPCLGAWPCCGRLWMSPGVCRQARTQTLLCTRERGSKEVRDASIAWEWRWPCVVLQARQRPGVAT